MKLSSLVLSPRFRLNAVLAVVSSFFIVVAGIFYFVAEKKAEDALIEQTLHREQIISRAGAESIESFFELLGAQVATFSTRNAIVTQNLEDSQAALDLFMEKLGGTPVAGIIFAGEDGKVLVNSNRTKSPDVGGNISDRDYFAWARGAKESEVFVSKSFVSWMGASKGKYIVVVAAPVVANGEFQGVLAAAVILSEVTDTYLTPLKISEKSQIYLVNREGILLSTTQNELVGQGFIQYVEDNPFPGSSILVKNLKELLASAFERGEGKFNYLRNSPEDKKTIKRWLLAYSGVDFGGKGLEQPEGISSQRWILGVETPAEDALVFFGPFSALQIASFVKAVLVVISFSALLILAVRVAQRNAYLKGFAEGRDHIDNSKFKNQNAK